MARRVYLHIGVPKSGTTYIQGVLGANTQQLEEQGVRYAAGEYSNDRVWATEVLRGFRFEGRPRQAPGAWDRILRQVREWDGDAVVSHEFFGACTEDQAARAHADLAPAEVHLVVTARDYVTQATAVWQERLKYGFTAPFSQFSLENDTPAWSWRTQDVPAILERWRHGLPVERIHLVTVPPPGGSPGELWERFASVIGADSARLTTQLPAANTSLGLVETELLRRVADRAGEAGLFERPQHRARYLRDVLANQILSQGSRERFTATPEQAELLARRAETAVSSLREAGYHVVGSLDDLRPRSMRQPARTPDDASEAELLDAAVQAIVGLLAEVKRRGRAVDADRATSGSTRRRPAAAVTRRAPRRLVETLRGRARRLLR